MDRTELIKAFGAFLAIMNPFVNLPVFLALTTGFTVAQQRSLAVRIAIYCAVMCLVVLMAGQQIIAFFGITTMGIILTGYIFNLLQAAGI